MLERLPSKESLQIVTLQSNVAFLTSLTRQLLSQNRQLKLQLSVLASQSPLLSVGKQCDGSHTSTSPPTTSPPSHTNPAAAARGHALRSKGTGNDTLQLFDAACGADHPLMDATTAPSPTNPGPFPSQPTPKRIQLLGHLLELEEEKEEWVEKGNADLSATLGCKPLATESHDTPAPAGVDQTDGRSCPTPFSAAGERGPGTACKRITSVPAIAEEQAVDNTCNDLGQGAQPSVCSTAGGAAGGTSEAGQRQQHEAWRSCCSMDRVGASCSGHASTWLDGEAIEAAPAPAHTTLAALPRLAEPIWLDVCAAAAPTPECPPPSLPPRHAQAALSSAPLPHTSSPRRLLEGTTSQPAPLQALPMTAASTAAAIIARARSRVQNGRWELDAHAASTSPFHRVLVATGDGGAAHDCMGRSSQFLAAAGEGGSPHVQQHQQQHCLLCSSTAPPRCSNSAPENVHLLPRGLSRIPRPPSEAAVHQYRRACCPRFSEGSPRCKQSFPSDASSVHQAPGAPLLTPAKVSAPQGGDEQTYTLSGWSSIDSLGAPDAWQASSGHVKEVVDWLRGSLAA